MKGTVKGGINKIFRNIAATKGKSDFEKVSSPFFILTILVTYKSNIPSGLQGTKRKTHHM